ncbi:MAG: copper resistance protein CopC [Pseudomonadota bacterium]
MMDLVRATGLAVAALILTATLAFAHSKMSTSTPPDGGTAKAGLERLQVAFEKPVRVVRVVVKRTDEASDVPVLEPGVSKFTTTYGVKVAPLGPGAYRLDWTAVAKDGHVMKGKLSFSVTP